MLTALLATSSAFVLPSRRITLPSRGHVSMELPVGEKLALECVKRLDISGRRAAVFFIFDDADASCKEEIEGFQASAAQFAASNCAIIGVRPPAGAADASEAAYGAVRFVADAPYDVPGSLTKMTIRRELDVSINQGLRGALPARATFVVDVAGVVQGAFIDEKDGSTHAAFALETLRAMGQETEAEMAFKKAAVLTTEGVLTVKRPSAVGRMREKQAREAAERAARKAEGGTPGWWPF